ncbi:hypothetical protein Tco_0149328 [Tanacetum coccineum]
METESDKIIKFSVENLVPIPSEFEGISNDTCDEPVCDDSSTFDAVSDHSEILSDSNDDGTSSDDDDFEDIDKLLADVRNINEELSEYINCPSWNRPIFYDNDDDEYTIIYIKLKAITSDLPTMEPDNSLSMGNEHLSTILETKTDKILSHSNDDGTSSDDDDFEDIEYVSLEEVNNDQEEKEFDLEDILQIQDVILREKLLNINRLITNIESLNDNPSPDRVFKSPSSVPIPVTDSDSFFEESDTSLSHLDNSLPELEPFSDDTEETRSGSTTTHANNSLPERKNEHFATFRGTDIKEMDKIKDKTDIKEHEIGKNMKAENVSNDEENKTEENKVDAEVAKKQARNVQTSLTLSSAKLEIQSMVDVPIHQEDPTV